MKSVVGPLVEFLREEAAGGIAVLAGTLVALAWANGWGDGYEAFWHRELGPLDLHHWVNDALMAVFFFVVGLEIKRELVVGRAARPPRGRAAGDRGGRRRGAPDRAVRADHGGRRGRRGLGDPGGDRHRVRDRRARAARRPRVRRRAAVPAGDRDRRRHRRHRDHRDLLRRATLALGLAAARRSRWSP